MKKFLLRKIVTSQLLFAIIFLFASGMFLPFVFLRDKAIAESQNFARDQLAKLSTSQNLTCNQLAKLSASQNATCSTRHFSHSFVDGQDEINVFSSSGATVAKLQKISTFCTSFVTSGESRSHNIALATSNFSWRTVGDKEEVSFNKIVGARREDRGYAIGKVIFDGEYINGVGGGVCQVSSTLYNAWIRANLGVISARAHSLPTSYCELSQDATVSDLIDMVLVNNSGFDLVINGYTRDKNLTFDIYGKPSDFDIQIKTRVLEYLPAPQTIIQYVTSLDEYDTKTIENNEQIAIVREGKIGYKSYATMQYFVDGKLAQERVFRRDVYAPVARKICKIAK